MMKIINFRKNQKGISLLGLLGVFFVGAFILIYGSQIGLAYIDKNTVQGTIKTVLSAAKSNDNATPNTIKREIIKKLSLGDSRLKADGLTVYTRSGGFVVDVKIEDVISITEDISILINFEFTEESP